MNREFFERITDRKGTDCLKYDFAQKRGKPADLLPLWVADMDFQTAPAIVQALEATAAHGIYGYSDGQEAYEAAVCGWYQERFGWNARPEWLVKTPGVVFALAMAVRAYTQPGEAVLIQRPVYYPFTEVIEENKRRVINAPLVYEQGRYRMDFVALERAITEHEVRLFLLCSPHNPVGRVWKREELECLGELCLRHGVIVVSDEIHSDFVYEGNRHLVFASLSEALAEQSLVCTSASKSFNLAGLQLSNIWIKNEKLRARFRAEMDASGYSQPNLMGLRATQAAYEGGAEWLEALRAYLAENLSYVREFLNRKLPQVRLVEPEGTYLLWLDCSALPWDAQTREQRLIEHGLWLDGGRMFGEEGSSFERINIACPRATLEKAMERLAAALRV